MKRAHLITAGLLAAFMLAAAVPASRAADPDTLYVRYIEGTVNLSEAGSAQAIQAVVNTPLIEGDSVATGPNGRAELFLKDSSMVRAGGNTVLRMIAVGDRGVQFTLEQGSAYIVSRGSREVPVFVNTPLTALDITSPSTVRVDAYSNGVNEISVLKGGIFASQRSGRMLVREGERLVLKPDGSMPVVAALRASDEWMLWNIQRDAMTMANAGTSESYAYLPEELRTFSSDLDANGQWVYTPEYDYVWVPTVIVAGAWSPYRYGRWAWIRGSYVWVGYEPWGWAPYHYGRWIHHGRAGWCWVPPKHRDVRWEPAHVAWINSSRHIGWVPLSPGERYDRRSAPVIHQANISGTAYRNVTMERSAAAAGTRYKNASVANSVVAVERDRMLSRKTANVTAAGTGPATLKRVSLPADVTPARAIAGAAGGQSTGRNTVSKIQTAGVPPRVAGSKGIAVTGTAAGVAPAPKSQPSVNTLQVPGGSLRTRIENARTSGTRNDTVSGGPRPQTPSVQPAGLKQEMGTRNTIAAPVPPVNAVRPAEPNKAPVRTIPPQVSNNPLQAGKKPSVNVVGAGSPISRDNVPSARALPSQPAVKVQVPTSAPARQANTVNHGPSVNPAVRAPVPQRQPSPVVSAAPQTVRAPESPRQSQTRTPQARVSAPQAVHQPPAASAKPAVSQAPQSAPRPAVSAAPPAKPGPAPAQPAKKDANQAADKNKPHA